MKKFGRLSYNNFIIAGEVDEQLPLYNGQAFPTCMIKNNEVAHGQASNLVSTTGVTVSDSIMNFNSSSKISLAPTLMDSNFFEIELKFKVTDMSSIIELFSSTNMKIKLDPIKRYLYLEVSLINTDKNKYSTPFELDNGYIITKSGAINKDLWYTLKINRFNSIISVLLNNATTKCLVYREDLSTTNIDIKNKGQIEYISINKDIYDSTDKTFPVTKTFRLNKTGDINHELDEVGGHYQVKNTNGKKYHLPLTSDFNSECNTITAKGKPHVCDGGAKSGIFETEKIIDLSVYKKDAIEIGDIGWNKNLHESAYSVPYWSDGCNLDVRSPEIGYHAHWVNEGLDTKDMSVKFINCNSEFGHTNRWLGVSTKGTLEEFFSDAKVGDRYTVLLHAKTDMPSKISAGIYRRNISDGKWGFGPNRKQIEINNISYEEYFFDFIVDDDWDLTCVPILYLYGYYVDRSTTLANNVMILKNSIPVSTNTAKDKVDRKIQIPFSSQIALNNNWHIVYKTKVLTANHYDSFGNDIHWGIEGNYFVVKFKNSSNQLASYAIPGLKAKELINEWIMISLSYISDKLTVAVFSKQGKHEITLNKTITSLYNEDYDYDIMLGGKDNVNYGCAIYKELNIINGWNISNTLLDNFFKTKISYYNNKLYSNVDIVESNL